MAEPLTPEQKELVQKNLDLAHFLARDAWSRNRNELDIEEVVSVAYQGLIKAAQRFDPSRMSPETVANGKAFAGFARHRIVGAIMDWQREVDYVQHRWRIIYKNLRKLGYLPKETPMSALGKYADELDVPVEKLIQVVRAVEHPNVSIDSEHASSSDDTFSPQDGEMWADGSGSVESSVIETQITSAVQRAYMDLPELQQAIITLRWYGQEEFQNIAVELDISLNLVRELHVEALATIHSAMVHSATEH